MKKKKLIEYVLIKTKRCKGTNHYTDHIVNDPYNKGVGSAMYMTKGYRQTTYYKSLNSVYKAAQRFLANIVCGCKVEVRSR